MNQRTCSHRLSELYAEIILKDRFKQEFSIQESFYYDNLFISVFRNHNFKLKLLIVDKESQNILFENITDSTYLFYNDVKNDSFLYALDYISGTIIKFNNPILNNGIINYSIKENHPFIELAKSINDVVIKDEVIYISSTSISIVNKNKSQNVSFNIINNESLDKLSDSLYFFDSKILIGICIFSLKEIGRKSFLLYSRDDERNFGVERLSIDNKKLNRKNSIIVDCMDSYYMEPISHLIDFKFEIVKQLHPNYAIEVNDSYLLLIPFYAYNTFSDFKLIRLIDLKEVDLLEISIIREIANDEINFFIGNTEFNGNDILSIGEYEFSCENLFSRKLNNTLEIKKTPNLKSLIPIKGNFFEGYSIEIHTIKSTLKEDGSFETLRTELGELIYKLKYNFDKNALEPLAQKCANIIIDTFSTIDVIIPAPPSNLNRPFQPVYELAARISELTNIPVDIDCVKKLPTEQIKTLSDQEDRNIVLERAISINDKRYKGKNILLFDDLFRSGDTLNAIAKKLKCEGEVDNIKVLCVTKTRTKR